MTDGKNKNSANESSRKKPLRAAGLPADNTISRDKLGKDTAHPLSGRVICNQCVKISLADATGVAPPHRAHAELCPRNRKRRKKLLSDPATKGTINTKSKKYKHSEGVICTQCVKIAVAKVRGVAAPHRAHAGFCPRKQQQKLLPVDSAKQSRSKTKKRQVKEIPAASPPLTKAPSSTDAAQNPATAIGPPSLPARPTKKTGVKFNRQQACVATMPTHGLGHPWCMPHTPPWLQPAFSSPWWISPGMNPQYPLRQMCCWPFAQWTEKCGRKGRPPHDANCCTRTKSGGH